MIHYSTNVLRAVRKSTGSQLEQLHGTITKIMKRVWSRTD